MAPHPRRPPGAGQEVQRHALAAAFRREDLPPVSAAFSALSSATDEFGAAGRSPSKGLREERSMGKVYTHMTMSLDGFIADPHDGCDELFGWYDAGEVTVPSADERWSFHVDAAGAEMLRGFLANTGALVCGRRLFDITNGWNGSHPVGAHVVVVTHQPPEDAAALPTTTFTSGVAEGIARAREIAAGKDVTVASADIGRQALELGLVDEVCVSLVPVLLGEGIPYFANLARAPHRFDDPVVIPGARATHLRYAVRRS